MGLPESAWRVPAQVNPSMSPRTDSPTIRCDSPRLCCRVCRLSFHPSLCLTAAHNVQTGVASADVVGREDLDPSLDGLSPNSVCDSDVLAGRERRVGEATGPTVRSPGPKGLAQK
jgi:hypothetical protein